MMRKAFSSVLIVLLFFSTLPLISFNAVKAAESPPPIEWHQVYRGSAEEWDPHVIQTADGGYLAAGVTSSAYGLSPFLLKADQFGSHQWNRTYGSYGGVISLVEASDGNYTLLASVGGVGSAWFFKVNTTGDVIWSKTYGTAGPPTCHTRTSDGGYALTGYGWWLLKVDSDGNEQWPLKVYGGWVAHSIIQTSDGGYALAGEPSSGGNGMLKVDSSGNPEWSRAYSGSANKIRQTSDGGYVLSGSTNAQGAGSYDFWLVRTDALGNMLWGKTYGEGGSDACVSLGLTRDGGYVLCGNTNQADILVVRTDSDGNEKWRMPYDAGGEDEATWVLQTSDGGYIIGAQTRSFSGGDYDFWLIKLETEFVPAEHHVAIRLGLESLQSLETGVLEGAKIVDSKALGTAVEVLKTAVSFIPVPTTRITVKIGTTIAKIGANELLDQIKSSEFGELYRFYTEGSFSNTMNMWKENITSLDSKFLEAGSKYSESDEFIQDMSAYHRYIGRVGNDYPGALRDIVDAHEWASFNRDLVFIGGGIAIIILTWGAATPYVVAFDAAYNGVTGIADIRDEQEFYRALSDTSILQEADALCFSGIIASDLKYLANKLESNDLSLPKISVHPTIANGGWIKNEYDKPLKIKYVYRVTLTCPDEQAVEPSRRYYEVPTSEFLLAPGSSTLYMKPEGERVPPDIRRWIDHLKSFGYRIYELGGVSILYGDGDLQAMKSAPFGPPSKPYLKVTGQCPINVLVETPDGLSIGYDARTSTVMNEVSGAMYSGHGTDPQIIAIPDPAMGIYSIMVAGTATGNYTLTIEYINATQTLAKSFSGAISPNQTKYYSEIIRPEGQVTPVSWEYVFKDTKRGTMLKISTDDKHFQFTAPGKDFGIKQDPKMIVLKNAIAICYNDSSMRMVVVAVLGRISFCIATAWDKQANKTYLLTGGLA
jgi:hypothetical protein